MALGAACWADCMCRDRCTSSVANRNAYQNGMPFSWYVTTIDTILQLRPNDGYISTVHTLSQHCWTQQVLRVCPHCCHMSGVVRSNLTICKLKPTLSKLWQTLLNRVAKSAEHVVFNNIVNPVALDGVLSLFTHPNCYHRIDEVLQMTQ